MKTITLHFNDSIAEKLTDFLATFSEKDLKIEHKTDIQFQIAKKEMQTDYNLYKKGETHLISVDDAEREMNLLFSEK